MLLQACPRCDRQFDVTHLSVGSRIRCLCDDILIVRTPRSLTVRGLRCSNCGGSPSEGDRDCPYCQASLADLERGGRLICPACFARMPEDARHCPACAVAIAPQALSPLPENRSCPRCEGKLQLRFLGPTNVVECSACEGLWLRPHVFEDVCREALDRASPLHGEGPSAERARPEKEVRYLSCLGCEDMMVRRNFRHRGLPSGVILDWCREHGVWLDKDELESISSFLRANAGRPSASLADPKERSVIVLRQPGKSEAPGSLWDGLLTFLGELLFESWV